MSQTIYKMAGKRDPFARIPHTMLEDASLSWRAKGILAYLCGKPDGWKTRAADIRKRGKEGETAVWTALRELRKAGYADLTRIISEDGKVKEWVWKVSDSPVFRAPDGRNPDVANPDVDSYDHSKKELSKKDCSKKQSEETKETASYEAAGFSPVWKPISGSKAEQLKAIEPPSAYPSEAQFDRFLEEDGLDHLLSGKRADLYRDLCVAKWHHWNGRRWHPVRDWKAYVRALDAKMDDATTGGF